MIADDIRKRLQRGSFKSVVMYCCAYHNILTAIPVLFDEMFFLITVKVNINFTSRHAGVRNRIFSGDNMQREGRQLSSRLRWTV